MKTVILLKKAGFIAAATLIIAALQLTEPAYMQAEAAAQNQPEVLSQAEAALIRDIENNLIAPCCWIQPVSEHPSEVSDMIRAEVRAMVAEGKNRNEILDYYVAKYGERILAAPRARGINALAYVAPVAALILGGGSLFLFSLFSGKRRAKAAVVEIEDTLPPQQNGNRYYDIIEEELREFDDKLSH